MIEGHLANLLVRLLTAFARQQRVLIDGQTALDVRCGVLY